MRTHLRRDLAQKSGPKHKSINFVSTFTLWMKNYYKMRYFNRDLLSKRSELWDHFLGGGRALELLLYRF